MSGLDELASLAERAATVVAAHLRNSVGRSDLEIGTKTTDTDLVTDVDRAAEDLLVATILGARPHDGMLGEEGTAVSGTTGVEWIVDPLDGTTNFVYGHPGFSVSIAAHVDGTPAVGVVADVMAEELFVARTGHGATRNGRPIRCAPARPLDQALAATGFGYDPERRRQQAEVLTRVLPRLRDIRRMGGAAVDLCSVACGRVDVYFERGLQPWDIAAGSIIATEAGAWVGDLTGGPPSDRYCVAAPPDLFDVLVALLDGADGSPP